MYQAPKLNVVGDAREVILGLADVGLDLDATNYYPDWEYGNDTNGPVPPPPLAGL